MKRIFLKLFLFFWRGTQTTIKIDSVLPLTLNKIDWLGILERKSSHVAICCLATFKNNQKKKSQNSPVNPKEMMQIFILLLSDFFNH